MPKQRIQKILAAAGYGSRRACETLVADGRVEIDGAVVRDLPIVVDPAEHRITVGGVPVRRERFVYFVLNKPKGYFVTNNDPDGRRRAIDLMVGVRERLFPVGRLDAESTGLLVMTNDGALAQKLTHPRFHTPKTYRLEVRGAPEAEVLDKLRAGVYHSEGRTGPADITVIHSSRKKTVLEVTVREGKIREIRRMFARFGHPVSRTMRIRMGKISIKRVPLGAYRPLTEAEQNYLQRLADGLEKEEPPPRQRHRKKPQGERPSQRGKKRGRGSQPRGAERVDASRGGAPKRGRKSSSTSGDIPSRKPPSKPQSGAAADRETRIAPRGPKKRRIISVD